MHFYSGEMAKKLPLLTVLSGPASSMRGAAFLSETDDAVVVDIGEITTNVGMIKSGLPCMSNDCFKVSYVALYNVSGYIIYTYLLIYMYIACLYYIYGKKLVHSSLNLTYMSSKS